MTPVCKTHLKSLMTCRCDRRHSLINCPMQAELHKNNQAHSFLMCINIESIPVKVTHGSTIARPNDRPLTGSSARASTHNHKITYRHKQPQPQLAYMVMALWLDRNPGLMQKQYDK